jgi:hypothetical protein
VKRSVVPPSACTLTKTGVFRPGSGEASAFPTPGEGGAKAKRLMDRFCPYQRREAARQTCEGLRTPPLLPIRRQGGLHFLDGLVGQL